MILGIVQARLASSRLPGKSMAMIEGKPMLAQQLERVRRSRLLDHLLVATSDEQADQTILQLCKAMGIDCFQCVSFLLLSRLVSSIFNPLDTTW